MKYKFEVEYDSDTGTYRVDPVSTNVQMPHSGSNYLRIKPDDGSFYGTVSCHHDTECYKPGALLELTCQADHLKFVITRNKP